MRRRCDPRYSPSPRYIELGITVCERWQSFENFLADMGERPPNHTIDRVDNDGHYTPDNCRWATWAQQVANKKKKTGRSFETVDGPMTVRQVAQKTGYSESFVRHWIRNNRLAEKYAEALNETARKPVITLTFGGETKTLHAWAKGAGIKYTTALAQHHRKWSLEQILAFKRG